jgi:hypothetical protein
MGGVAERVRDPRRRETRHRRLRRRLPAEEHVSDWDRKPMPRLQRLEADHLGVSSRRDLDEKKKKKKKKNAGVEVPRFAPGAEGRRQRWNP